MLLPKKTMKAILETTVDGTMKLTSLPKLSVPSFISFTGFSKAQQLTQVSQTQIAKDHVNL